jgi:anti-sigma B factor antagonist
MMRGDGAFGITHEALDGSGVMVHVQGELDLASAPSLKWALTDLLQTGVQRMVLDLSRVSFIDSTALSVLVGVQRALPQEGRIAIAAATAEVCNILELTGLDATFEMLPSVEDALSWVRGSAAAAG